MDLGLTASRTAFPRLPARWREAAPAMALVVCAVFLFFDPRPLPIQVWDESRIAVNALEMHLRGFSLVTTYGFAPDLWNTKPPLLVWLIDAAMAVVGPSELAVRLPSMAAALGTLALTASFTRRMTGSAWAAAFAVVLLALSVGFFAEHGARTGDYDALLCLFTTAYMQRLFFAAHRRRPRAGDLILAGLLVAAAVMTKSIAGLIPGVGFGVYLLACGRWRRPLGSAWYLAFAALAVVPVAIFCLARERAAPGYLAAAWGNDVTGRFLTTLDQHQGPPWAYLGVICRAAMFSAGPVGLLSVLALMRARGKARQGLLFCAFAAGGVIFVVSCASTKLAQYIAAAYPFLASATAIAVHTALKRAEAPTMHPRIVQAVRAGAVVVVAFVVTQGLTARYLVLPERAFIRQALYGELFTGLSAQGHDAVSVVDSGVEAVGVPPGYSPQLRFYTLLWAGQGLTADHAPNLASARRDVVASCDGSFFPALERMGPDIAHLPGCRAVLRR